MVIQNPHYFVYNIKETSMDTLATASPADRRYQYHYHFNHGEQINTLKGLLAGPLKDRSL